MTAPVEFCRDSAVMPVRHGDAAGYDVCAAIDAVVPSGGGRAMVPTGLKIAAPPGTYVRIAPRSGLAWKLGIATMAGVIDRDYRGEIQVVLINHGSADFQIGAGDRVAQLIFEKIETPVLVSVPSLDDTSRGQGGFGSTGK